MWVKDCWAWLLITCTSHVGRTNLYFTYLFTSLLLFYFILFIFFFNLTLVLFVVCVVCVWWLQAGICKHTWGLEVMVECLAGCCYVSVLNWCLDHNSYLVREITLSGHLSGSTYPWLPRSWNMRVINLLSVVYCLTYFYKSRYRMERNITQCWSVSSVVLTCCLCNEGLQLQEAQKVTNRRVVFCHSRHTEEFLFQNELLRETERCDRQNISPLKCFKSYTFTRIKYSSQTKEEVSLMSFIPAWRFCVMALPPSPLFICDIL